jgi:hypothetical protein
MKTVPSGRSDFCIKAAPAVMGTLGLGVPRPAIVVRPVRVKAGPSDAEPVSSDELDSEEELLLDSSDDEPLVKVMAGADPSVLVGSVGLVVWVLDDSSSLSSSVFEVSAGGAGAFVRVFPVVWAGGAGAGAGAGLLVFSGTSCARTLGAMSRARPKRAIEGRMAKVQSADANIGNRVGRVARLPRRRQL